MASICDRICSFCGADRDLWQDWCHNNQFKYGDFFRTIIILLVTAAIVTGRNEWHMPSQASYKSLVFLVLSGIATGLSWLCYYRALQLGPASKVAPVDKLSVAFAMILAFTFLGEKLTLKALIGGGLVTLGSLVIAL